jgi:hypothetical protein
MLADNVSAKKGQRMVSLSLCQFSLPPYGLWGRGHIGQCFAQLKDKDWCQFMGLSICFSELGS